MVEKAAIANVLTALLYISIAIALVAALHLILNKPQRIRNVLSHEERSKFVEEFNRS